MQSSPHVDGSSLLGHGLAKWCFIHQAKFLLDVKSNHGPIPSFADGAFGNWASHSEFMSLCSMESVRWRRRC